MSLQLFPSLDQRMGDAGRQGAAFEETVRVVGFMDVPVGEA